MFGHKKRSRHDWILRRPQRPTQISPELLGTAFESGKFVSLVWVSKARAKARPARTYLGLGSVHTGYLSLGPGAADRARTLLVEGLNLPTAGSLERPDLEGELLKLDLAITEIKPGSSLGFGNAWVQIEGAVSLLADDTPLIKFVHRRQNATHLILGPPTLDAGVDEQHGLYLAAELIPYMAHDILMELDQHLNQTGS